MHQSRLSLHDYVHMHVHMHMCSITSELVHNHCVTQRPTPHPSLITHCSHRTTKTERDGMRRLEQVKKRVKDKLKVSAK